MRGLLRVEIEGLQFKPEVLYPNPNDLEHLAVPFQEEKIENAIMGLAKGKALGPDELPNEFIQTYWHELKEEIVTIMNKFYNNRADLLEINKANVVMVPKKEEVVNMSNFRPISILNLISKIISKVLANQLGKVLPEIISDHQTAFIKGRQIFENFIAARETLHHI